MRGLVFSIEIKKSDNMVDVELISYTKDADRLCGAIARSCYSEDDAGKIIMNNKDYSRVLRKTLKSGHHSVIEHAVFTFNISNISRVTTHQLVRHRMASYTQQSQRYTKHTSMDMVFPNSMISNEDDRHMLDCLREAIDYIAQEYREQGVPEEDIRYLYPNAMCTNIVVTMNARSLWNFFSLRCCDRAQWEIRDLANKMLVLCKDVAPIIFEDAGEPCLRGACPEGALSCGREIIHGGDKE